MAEELEVSRERVAKIIDVLSLLSMGAYDPALAHIEVGGEQEYFSELEQALALFVKEIIGSRQDGEAAIARLESSRREVEQKLELIERQQLAIRELSTPIIEVWDDVLVLPVVGLVDSQRALDMTEGLLEHVSNANARFVLIDLTGIDVIDTMTANHFIHMIRAARLLGTTCLITGMSPDMARTVVSLGVDLGAAGTLRSLKEGLAFCLRQLRSKG